MSPLNPSDDLEVLSQAMSADRLYAYSDEVDRVKERCLTLEAERDQFKKISDYMLEQKNNAESEVARLTTQVEVSEHNKRKAYEELSGQCKDLRDALQRADVAESALDAAKGLVFKMQYTATSYPQNNFYKEATEVLIHYSKELEKTLAVFKQKSEQGV